MNNLFTQVKDNAGFLAVVLLVAAILVVAAKGAELYICKMESAPKKTMKIAVIGMMAALAFVLQMFEFPLPFLAPSFYELDFSEVPVLIAGFSLGPVAGVLTELVKNLLKILMRGTSTAFVGDFANFVIGSSLVIPASIIYCRHKTKKNAILGCAAGTVFIAIVGSLFNAFYLLPAFSKLYGMDLDIIIGMGASIFPKIENFTIYHFVMCCVAPINLIKGCMDAVVVVLIYKPISKILHNVVS